MQSCLGSSREWDRAGWHIPHCLPPTAPNCETKFPASPWKELIYTFSIPTVILSPKGLTPKSTSSETDRDWLSQVPSATHKAKRWFYLGMQAPSLIFPLAQQRLSNYKCPALGFSPDRDQTAYLTAWFPKLEVRHPISLRWGPKKQAIRISFENLNWHTWPFPKSLGHWPILALSWLSGDIRNKGWQVGQLQRFERQPGAWVGWINNPHCLQEASL